MSFESRIPPIAMSEDEEDPLHSVPVTVVIPTFNRAADLERGLGHLARQTVGALRVVVVDNSSADRTPEMIRDLKPAWEGRLRYIRREPNGPSSARNTGLAATTTPYVLFLDSDIDLPPDWVARALSHLTQDPGLGAVGGYILYAFDSRGVNAYGGDLGRMGLAWDVDEGTVLDPSKGPAPRIWINCSAMLARTSAVRDAGGFDETFFYGYEDSDLGWRLNLMGHRVAVFPDLCAKHNVSEDQGFAHPEIVFHYCKNRLRSVLKNASTGNLPVMLAGYAAYSIADLLARAPRVAKMRAVVWNLARLGDTLAMRRAVQRKRTAPDSVVFGHGSRRWLPPTPLGGRRRRPAGEAGRRGYGQSEHSAADDRL
jgi:GT2 family glycosyltransferase